MRSFFFSGSHDFGIGQSTFNWRILFEGFKVLYTYDLVDLNHFHDLDDFKMADGFDIFDDIDDIDDFGPKIF